MKDNKIIAEFMGYDISTSLRDGVECVEYADDNIRALSDTHYHTSWDWLMPVIKKINEQMSPNVSGLWRMITHPYEYHIKDVFSQVVEFIKDRG